MDKIKNLFLEKIRPSVFWDCDMQKLDFDKDINFIISRILMRGIDSEIHLVEDTFSLEKIVDAVEYSYEADDRCKKYYKMLKKLRHEH